MTTQFPRRSLAVLTCIAAIAFATPSMAGMVNLKAALDGKSEVPPNSTAGKGELTATYDTDSKKLTWKGSYSGLTGPATAAHFHEGAPGKNGGVVVPINPHGPSFEGSATLTDAQARQMLAGDWYVNVHTAANKGGELRGQLTK